MKDFNVMDYLNLLMVADVKLENGQLSFNGSGSCGAFRQRLMEKEMQLAPRLRGWIECGKNDRHWAQLLNAYVRSAEQTLGMDDGTGWGHRHLSITRDGRACTRTRLTAGDRKVVMEFLELQRESFLRQRDFIFAIRSLLCREYRLNCKGVDWLELGEALWRTGQVTSLGPDKSEKAFLAFFFNIFGADLPANFQRQLSQLRERKNPVQFMERTSREFVKQIEEKLK